MSSRFYTLLFAAAAGVLAAVTCTFAVFARPTQKPPAASEPQSRPAAASVEEAASRVDRVFTDAWRETKVETREPADPLLVARRLSLALCGTVPSLAEIRTLEKLPVEKRIDAHLEHLLADRRFADYWAERLARVFVGTQGGPFIIYRRRRFVYWLSDELAKNRPYDDLVREIISAEGLWTDRPATNFITAFGTEEGLQKIPLAARTTRAFLGLRIDCAQCHDHPFADWKQGDFHGLASFFGPTANSLKGIEDKGGDYEMEERDGEKRKVDPHVPFGPEYAATDGRLREQLAYWITSPQNPYFGQAIANRVWTLLFGSGLVDPVDNLEADPCVPGVLELLGDDFRIHGHDLRRLIRVIVATRAFRMSSAGCDELQPEQETTFAVFPMTRLRSDQIAGSLIQVSSLRTVDADSNVLVRFARAINAAEFINRYGDAGEEELNAHIGTIPQRLAMMNSKVPRERTNASPFTAAGRISSLAPDDVSRVRTAYLICLARLPTSEEEAHFIGRLKGLTGTARSETVEDIMWALINSTEFSWNH